MWVKRKINVKVLKNQKRKPIKILEKKKITFLGCMVQHNVYSFNIFEGKLLGWQEEFGQGGNIWWYADSDESSNNKVWCIQKNGRVRVRGFGLLYEDLLVLIKLSCRHHFYKLLNPKFPDSVQGL